MIEAGDYFALQASMQPQRQAVRDLTSGEIQTYRDLDAQVGRCAAALRAHGVGVGDRLAVLARNRAVLVALHGACARLGAIYVPLNWRLSASEIAALVADCEPRLILCNSTLGAIGLNGVDLDAFAAETVASAPLPPRPVDRERPSLILYTSGTSGRPKGALISEGNIEQSAFNFSLLGRVTHDSVFLCDTPMFHVIGLVATVRSAILRGGALLISDGFAASRTLARLSDPALGVTHYFCVPQMAAMLRSDPAYDPDRLRKLTAIFTGGAPHPAAAIRAWLRDEIVVADGFGMSETGTVSCMPLDLDLIDRHAGSVGFVPPGVSLRIADAVGRDFPPGEAGELLVRGANVTRGYWRRPAETEFRLHAGRLASQRRHCARRRRRIPLVGGSQEGHVYFRRRECLSRRGRSGIVRPSRHRGMRGRRRA